MAPPRSPQDYPYETWSWELTQSAISSGGSASYPLSFGFSTDGVWGDSAKAISFNVLAEVYDSNNHLVGQSVTYAVHFSTYPFVSQG
ncbi:MAG: hypothetical protein ACOYBP_04430 [Microbacteriaceae bacterium]